MRYGLVLATAALGLSLSQPAQADRTLVFGSWYPGTSPAAAAFEEFARKVEADTKGALTFEFQHDGKVSTLRTGLQSLNSSIVDAAIINGVAHTKQMPVEAMFLDHAAQASNPFAMTGAMMETTLDCPECMREIDRNKLVFLGYAAQASYYLMCRDQVSGLDWFKGKSVRAVAAFSRFVASMGATPVFTQPTEVYEAIQRGQVACVVAAGYWLQTFSLADVVRYVYDLPLGQSSNDMYAVSQSTWTSLAPAERTAIVANLPYLLTRNAERQVQQTAESRAESERKGVRWLPMPDDVRAHYQRFVTTEPASVADIARKNGVKDPDTILKAWAANLAEWNARFGPDADPATFEKALREEIYVRHHQF